MKKVIAILLAALLLLSVTACQNTPQEEESKAGEPVERVQLGDWSATADWTAEGERLTANSKSGSYACNTALELEDAFEFSVNVQPGESIEETGVILADKNAAKIVDFRLIYADGKVTVKGSYALNDMQKEILTSDAFAADGALTLKVSKEAGNRKLSFCVENANGELFAAEAEEIPSLVARSVKWGGVYAKGEAVFESYCVKTEDPIAMQTVSPIDPQPHVDNENYMFSYGAICNKDANGNDLIIVDNQEGEAAAWNTNYLLGSAWTIKARAQVGNCREGTGGARFALLGEDNNTMLALVTCRVDPVSLSLMFENAQDGTNYWATTAGASKWYSLTTPAFDIVITRHAGENCLYIQVSDINGEVLHSVQTSDYPAGVLDMVKHFGFCVWQTQTQYSNIEVDTENSVDIEVIDRSFIEGITDEQYMNFDRKQTTDAWDITPEVYYQSGSQTGDALLLNSEGDLTATTKQAFGSDFSISMDVKYLLNYDNTNHTRLFFRGENQTLPFIVDLRSMVGTYILGAQYQLNGEWTDYIFPDATGTLLDDDFRIEISKSAQTIRVRVLDTDGTVLMDDEVSDFPGINDIRYLEIHSASTVTILDNIEIH